MNYIHLEQTDSTNSWAALHSGELADMTMVTATSQIAGRGQRGNSWESEPGKNLTFSLFHIPAETMLPRLQFYLSEAVALAISDALRSFGVETKVKWPNDIYAGDSKICGILIEHSLLGRRIRHTIAGAGINVNQREFHSDAPNPVSMYMLLGRDTDTEEVKMRVAEALEKRLGALAENPDAHHAEYLSRLWRGDGGKYPFRDVKRDEMIEASIKDVASDGTLTLRLTGGEERSYAFKEVEFLLQAPPTVCSVADFI